MVETFAEFLFYLTGGVPLALTVWIFPYIVILLLLIAVTVDTGLYYLDKKHSKLGFISLPIVIYIFFFGMGAPLTQANMLKDNCIHHEISTPNDNTTTITECLVKDNYYDDDENGKWKITNK